MISSNLGAGYALVPVPPDDNPDHGGGPIRKSVGLATYAQAGNNVYRTPLLVVREAEAGAGWPTDLSTTKMFLPDGRLVDQEPFAQDMFHGAAPGTVIYAQPVGGGFLRSLIPAAGMFIGAGAGYKMASKHRGWAMIGGAIVGGVLGRIFR